MTIYFKKAYLIVILEKVKKKKILRQTSKSRSQ